MNLYEIVKELAMYEMEFDEDGCWVNEEELDNLNLAKDEKIENILLLAKNLRAEASAIKAEEDALKERRKAKENKADRLEDYAAFGLGGEKFETPRVKVSWRNITSVEILNEDAVPDRFCKIEVGRTPVKAEIKKELQRAEDEGREVPWARLNKYKSMSIK